MLSNTVSRVECFFPFIDLKKNAPINWGVFFIFEYKFDRYNQKDVFHLFAESRNL